MTPGDPMKINEEPWESLREYFDSKDCNQLSLLVSIRDYGISSALHFIDGHGDKVTSLNITLSFGSAMFNNSLETSALIAQLTNALLATPNLKQLELSFTDPNQEYRIWPIQSLSEPLASLQGAFDKLERLDSLRINGIFIHPSFFLKVPKSVRNLELQCMTSPIWWREFATYPFENVENLVLYHEIGEPRWGDHPSEITDGIRFGQYPILLGSVAISTLKSFSGQGSLSGPSDILECILANNKGLEGRHSFIADWDNEVLPELESCGLILLDCLSESVIRYKKYCTWKHQQANGGTNAQLVQYFFKQCLKSLEKRVNEVYGQNYS
ncbi:hypothetical protein AOL_s00079g160 [Orbilia oligospora ATCC 24927]|uniref:Uncharacterized protein n=1 Tax=Arthrobotrys oligospora (strain ATCC 24927 / CBS 115.81 / DSM 1491) TaxID=756982 RepID=G1XD57_ARTOA|nr:hypothetical protein AOL_s00079g160 [Orbilia oligospora ATCC 24927]EGX48939.1 hypothetical protein AOL_s00079g160 [Orbilia oligospora ATCC 24927]